MLPSARVGVVDGGAGCFDAEEARDRPRAVRSLARSRAGGASRRRVPAGLPAAAETGEPRRAPREPERNAKGVRIEIAGINRGTDREFTRWEPRSKDPGV